MPVTKHRSVQEMKPAEPLPPLEEANLRAACELIGVAWGLRPWRFTPGVRKYRSMEEASRARTEWEKAQARPAGDSASRKS